MQYEELLIFRYASCQISQPWIRKFVMQKYICSKNMLLKLGNQICAYADFAKLIYEILNIWKKIHVYPGKSEYNCFFPFAVGPLDLISILFINIAIVI